MQNLNVITNIKPLKALYITFYIIIQYFMEEKANFVRYETQIYGCFSFNFSAANKKKRKKGAKFKLL